MGGINKELNYMKYLLGYQRGVIISEQKILLEQTKADYDQIASDLSGAYGATLKKYGFKDNVAFYGTDKNGTLIDEYTGKPTVVGISLSSLHNNNGQDYDTAYFSCLAPIKIINPISNKPVNTSAFLGNNFPFLTPGGLDYRYSDLSGEKDDTKKNALRKNFSSATKNIGNQICNLIESKSKGEDVTKQIEGIKKVESESQQKKTTTATTQQTTKPGTTTTTKPGTTTTTKPGTTTTAGGSPNKIFSDAIVNITYNQNLKSYTVEGFASLATMGTDSAELVKKVNEAIRVQILKNPALVVEGKKGNLHMTLAEVRGGASNTFGGPIGWDITFKGDDYRNPIFNQDKSNTKLYGKGYIDNNNLALERAKGFLSNLKAALPKVDTNGVGIKVAGFSKDNVVAYTVNTGGVADDSSERNWTGVNGVSKIPGQQVYFKLTIRVLPNMPSGSQQSKPCLANSKISIDYYDGNNHSCDVATFDLVLNGEVLIGTADIGNGVLCSSGTIVDGKGRKFEGKNLNLKGVGGDRNVGGTRTNTFTITPAFAEKVMAKSKVGEVEIWLKGKGHAYYSDRYKNYLDLNDPTNKCMTTHMETPSIKFTKPDGTVVNLGMPFGTFPRCGGCEGAPECVPQFVVRYNPCGKDLATSVISSGVGNF